MSELQRIIDQYDRAMKGSAWHGDPVWRILNGIEAAIAASRAHPAVHTIWELVSHMTFWESEVCRRGKSLPPRPLDELNFPVMPAPTKTSWERALDKFRKSNADFRKMLLEFDPYRLAQPFPGREQPAYVELYGVIEHNLYHAGQIVMLRKILGETKVVGRL